MTKLERFHRWYLSQSAKAPADRGKPPPKRAECIHLGMALPRESGPCVHRLRGCDVFGVCTVQKCDKAEHSCADCPEYEVDA